MGIRTRDSSLLFFRRVFFSAKDDLTFSVCVEELQDGQLKMCITCLSFGVHLIVSYVKIFLLYSLNEGMKCMYSNLMSTKNNLTLNVPVSEYQFTYLLFFF